MKESLTSNEAIIHVDFSEKFECKWSTEVQAAHFGTRNQIVLHQGVMYRRDKDPQSFLTLSDDSRKTAPPVAAHINSIVEELIGLQSTKLERVSKFSFYQITGND